MYTQVDKKKENNSRSIINSAAKMKSDERKFIGFDDNRNTNLTGSNKITAQGKMLQLKKPCIDCGYEKGHDKNCTPQTRAKKAKGRKEKNRELTDQSMDGRTREDQSHKQHGGDAKGRTKMHERRKKKDD
jgi:hypothetical protein